MTKWEYANLGTPNANHPDIAKMGLDGWELVTVLPIIIQVNPLMPQQTAQMLVHFFKRPIEAVDSANLLANPSGDKPNLSFS